MNQANRKRFRNNDRIWEEFDKNHPARRYLSGFYDLRQEVCGREIEWPDQPAIDQQWYSQLLQREYSFSGFAYSFISYTLLLDEWFDRQFQNRLSPAEQDRIAIAPFLHALLSEGQVVAAVEGNEAILGFIVQTRTVIDLGITATAYRLGKTCDELLQQWGREPLETANLFLELNRRERNGTNKNSQ